MTRSLIAAVLMLFVLYPSPLVAQDQSDDTATSNVGGQPQSLNLSSGVVFGGAPPALQAQQGPTGRAPISRRPSMVGYIEDATIATQVRVRFDAGFGNDRPDRAEFFYAKCGCYHFDAPPFEDLDAPGPAPGVPLKLNFQQFYVLAEFAARDRMSVFAEVPFRAIQPKGFIEFGSPYDPFPDQSGIGDIHAGVKFSLMANENGTATVALRAGFPTGDASKGMGTDNFEIEPVLLFEHSLSDRVGIEGQFGSWHPFGGSKGVDSPDKFSGNIIYYGVGPSFDLVNTGRMRFSPVVELVGWHVIGGFQTGCFADLTCTYDADDDIVNLKFGARATVNDRDSIYVGYGLALTSAVWYDRILRVEYRRGF